jgi:hypothetical protein
MAVGQVARTVAALYLRPRTALAASALQLLAFWVVGILFTPRLGSLGSSVAMLVTRTLYALYFTWRMRSALRYSLREGAMVLGLGALFLPLVLLRSSWVINVSLYAACLVGYSMMLLITQVVTRSEVAELWQAITAGARTPEVDLGEE